MSKKHPPPPAEAYEFVAKLQAKPSLFTEAFDKARDQLKAEDRETFQAGARAMRAFIMLTLDNLECPDDVMEYIAKTMSSWGFDA